jgi:hypothetical protein
MTTILDYLLPGRAILAKLNTIIQKENMIMAALDDLKAAVAAEDTVVDSAVTLLQGLKAALDAAIASGDPAALTALSADITAKTKALSDAVAANTPAAPAPSPAPAP